MSWEAFDWALRQQSGSARCKLVLLALGSFADKNGICWPSQETLAKLTEQSVDTIQRQLVALERRGFIRRERMPKRRGQWRGHRYQLAMPTATSQSKSRGHTAATRSGHAAKSSETRPLSLRHKPSIEPSHEPSREAESNTSAERLRAFQSKQENTEVIQNRIAQRMGIEGWLLLGAMTEKQLARVTRLERLALLSDEELSEAMAVARLQLLER
ncbi:helix-turn-helix domain-containing protein [Tardiphaga robiniae]|uniref:helix-turn-helix domain-containing protein n=1 Tax=Tardiphaga robiniae TaxID=943830 RepID=UPI0035B51427